MIRAKIYTKGDSIHMVLKGHAASAPYGEDLICASATILAYTVAQAIQYMHESDRLKRKPKIRLMEGSITIICTPKEDSYEEALHTFWVAQCGIELLAHNYPQNVSLEPIKV